MNVAPGWDRSNSGTFATPQKAKYTNERHRTVKMDSDKSPVSALVSWNQSCKDGELEIGA